MSTDILNLLGSELGNIHIRNPLDVISISQKGITKNALVHLCKILSLDQKEMAELASLSIRTFQLYDDNKKLSPIISENIIQITQVIRLGLNVFKDRDALIKWLNSPNKALGQKKPMELLKFRIGSELVRNLLGQIQYGIIA